MMAGLAALHMGGYHPGPNHHHHLPSHHSRINGSEGSDDGSPLSPGGTTPPMSPSQEARGSSLLDTPTRKNKRKLSEPRKRAGSDFSIKRLCPDSADLSESGCSDDEDNDNNNRVVPNGKAARGKDGSASRRPRERGGHKKRPSAKQRKAAKERADSASRVASSERNDTLVPRAGSSTNGLHLPPGPHHPFFPAGLPPGALGFMPGFYLGPDGRPATFPPSLFPGLPLGLPHPHPAFTATSTTAGSDPQPSRDLVQPYSLSHLPPPGSGFTAQDLTSRPDSPDNSGDNCSDDNDGEGGSGEGGGGGRKPRKNYKNMTRERRVEANARERTRVHTISAAFDALRRAVPSYSYNQKLSKLAILRIACTYIMALARLADVDCSQEPAVPLTFADCVDLCTRTIQTEGRARRRH